MTPKEFVGRAEMLMDDEIAAIRFADRTVYGRHGGFHVSVERGHQTAFTASLKGGRGLKIVIPPEAVATFGGKLKDTRWISWSLNWHELGHVLFTDMTLKAVEGIEDPSLREFTMQIVNILEDVKIEKAIKRLIDRDFPGYGWLPPSKTFAMMDERYWGKCAERWSDDGSVDGFVNYLLLWARLGKDALPPCKAFLERSEWLIPGYFDAIFENDPAKRQAIQVSLAKRIWDSFPKEAKSAFDPGEILRSPGEGISFPIPGGLGLPCDGEGDPGPDGDPSGEEGDGAPLDGPSPFSADPDGDWDDALESSSGHSWISAAEDMEADSFVGAIMGERLDRAIPIADGVSDFLKLFKGRKKPRWVGGMDSGDDIDVDAVADIERTGVPSAEIFGSELPRGKTTDLAVCVLVDRSGSMSGPKATVAVDAALAMSYACDEAGVPFQVLSFAKTRDSINGEAITMVHKDWGDSLSDALPRFGAADINLCGHYREITEVGGDGRDTPSWGGNSEETNLWHIWRKLRLVKHERKLLIVFCDGCTTGSDRALANVVREMSDDGIDVIGVGICDDGVDGIYPRSAVFGTRSELESGLAPFLLDTLADMATAE